MTPRADPTAIPATSPGDILSLSCWCDTLADVVARIDVNDEIRLVDVNELEMIELDDEVAVTGVEEEVEREYPGAYPMDPVVAILL